MQLRHAPLLFLMPLMIGACSIAPDVTIEDAETAIAQNRFRDARDALLALREHGDRSSERSMLLARVIIELGDGYTAERYLSEVEDTKKNSADWITSKAHALILQGRSRTARELVENFAGPQTPSEDHLHLLVWAAMEEGEISDARDLVFTALSNYPRSTNLHAKAGRLSAWSGDWARAGFHIDQALIVDPTHYESLLIQGEKHIADGDLASALETYETAVKAHPDFAVPRANMVGLLLDLGDLEKGETELEKALNLHPDFTLLRFNAARLQAMKRNWAKTRDMLQGLPLDWKRSFPAATLLEAETEIALGNRAIAQTLLMQLADDPRFSDQVAEILQRDPFNN